MMKVKGGAREASIHAVIRRADGTVQDLGCVSYWHKNPLKRWAFKLKRMTSFGGLDATVSKKAFVILLALMGFAPPLAYAGYGLARGAPSLSIVGFLACACAPPLASMLMYRVGHDDKDRTKNAAGLVSDYIVVLFPFSLLANYAISSVLAGLFGLT